VESGLKTLRSTTNAVSLSAAEAFIFSGAGALISIAGTRLSREPTVEINFHVAGALELSKIHVVHTAASVNQGVAMMVSEPPSSTLPARGKNAGTLRRSRQTPERLCLWAGVTAL